MNRQGTDIERWFREMAPMELGFVAVERQESTAGFYIYYTIEEPEEDVRKKGNTWHRVVWMNPGPGMDNSDWDNFIHLEGEAAERYVNKQFAIHEFLSDWANGLKIERDLMKHIYVGLGFKDTDGIFCLTAEEIVERNDLARQFLQNHLLHASVDG